MSRPRPARARKPAALTAPCPHSIVEQPFKIPFLAAVFRVANAENPEAGRAVVEHIGEALQRYLHVGAFRNVKLVLRFLACLGDMIGDEGVAPILEALIEKLPAYQGDGNEVCRLLNPSCDLR